MATKRSLLTLCYDLGRVLEDFTQEDNMRIPEDIANMRLNNYEKRRHTKMQIIVELIKQDKKHSLQQEVKMSRT